MISMKNPEILEIENIISQELIEFSDIEKDKSN